VTLLAVTVLGGILALVLSGLYDQSAVLRDWKMLLAPWGEDAYQELEGQADGASRMADLAFRRASEARAAGTPDEALRLLDVGLKVLEGSSAQWTAFLRGMGLLSRLAAAIAPVEPLAPSAFRGRQLWGLAAFGRLAHHLLVTTAERFRLRVYVLRRGFGVATRMLLHTTQRIRAGGDEAEWARLETVRADLRTLPAESLRTFHWFLVSLAAQRRA